MSATEVHNASRDAAIGTVDMKLEVQIIPVSDAARQLARRQSSWQLQQRQRIAAHLGDDLFADPCINRPGQHQVQQRPRVRLRSPSTASSGNPSRAPPRTRAANTRPTDSTARRRATNARTCAEA